MVKRSEKNKYYINKYLFWTIITTITAIISLLSIFSINRNKEIIELNELSNKNECYKIVTEKNKKIELLEDSLISSARIIKELKNYNFKNKRKTSKNVVMIKGLVQDTYGNRIEGVLIVIDGIVDITNSVGTFSINIPQNEEIKYINIHASKEGYKTMNLTYNVNTEIKILMNRIHEN